MSVVVQWCFNIHCFMLHFYCCLFLLFINALCEVFFLFINADVNIIFCCLETLFNLSAPQLSLHSPQTPAWLTHPVRSQIEIKNLEKIGCQYIQNPLFYYDLLCLISGVSNQGHTQTTGHTSFPYTKQFWQQKLCCCSQHNVEQFGIVLVTKHH